MALAAFKIGDRVRVINDLFNGMPGTITSSPDEFDLYSVRLDSGISIKTTSDEMERIEPENPGRYEQLGASIGAHVDKAKRAYGDAFGQAGDVLRVFLRPYRNEDGTYTIPDSLIDHLLPQTRIIDKQFRVFSNPDGDLMKESPYFDMAGYSILGAARAGEKT